eukprot:gnl/Spiro4/23825_TR11787_c0_g1_i1.p1 gnl/Spiro4/23825_TR11787_c0_g1~~gnl/Spiro4/23825_TR11787_c0_g1_i1.p1  ORF type:complete len:615 (+),score=140.34 gnl/Spiro4/23825_TR11787_c0_g1_i1:80-1924(+)
MSEFVLTEYSIEDSDEEFQYDDVVVSDDDVSVNNNLDGLLKSIKNKEQPMDAVPSEPVATITRSPEVIDDFIRNYLIKIKLFKTLDTFQTEWYELKEKGKIGAEDIMVVPNIYQRNQELDDLVKSLKEELAEMKLVSETARATWDTLRKERDLHKMHHKRVVQEKNALLQNLKRLKQQYATYEPTIRALEEKRLKDMRDKTALRMDRDKLAVKVSALEVEARTKETTAAVGHGRASPQVAASTSASAIPKPKRSAKPTAAPSGVPPRSGGAGRSANAKTSRSATATSNVQPNDSPLPDVLPTPTPQDGDDEPNVMSWGSNQSFKGHKMAITSLSMHPTKSFVATSSDDHTWRLWTLPSGEQAMVGIGHQEYVTSVAFHPRGVHVATGSGDNTVCLWDILSVSVSCKFTDHTLPVWRVVCHGSGDFIASASRDCTARLFDINSQRCRQTFRSQHPRPVLYAEFHPFLPVLATANVESVISLWDMRKQGAATTLRHSRATVAVNSLTFNRDGSMFASSGADGVVRLWDMRSSGLRSEIPAPDCGAALSAQFDTTGNLIATCYESGVVRIYKVSDLSVAKQLESATSRDRAVNALVWDHGSRSLIGGAADGTFRMYS